MMVEYQVDISDVPPAQAFARGMRVGRASAAVLRVADEQCGEMAAGDRVIALRIMQESLEARLQDALQAARKGGVLCN